MQNKANEKSSVTLGVTAHYDSTVVPYFPAQTEKEVYHGGQFFRKLKLTLQSQKNPHYFQHFFFHGKPSKADDKVPCPLSRGQSMQLNPFWVNQGHWYEHLLSHYIIPSMVLPLAFFTESWSWKCRDHLSTAMKWLGKAPRTWIKDMTRVCGTTGEPPME